MSENTTTVTITVAEDDGGMRLDRFLAQRCAAETDSERPALSRVRLTALIEAGAVSRSAFDGTSLPITVAKTPVKPGESYLIHLGPAVAAAPLGEAIPLTVVYEDRDLIVVDKPAGLVVHPAAGHTTGTLVNALIAHCGDSLSGIGGVRRPGIVHRLDKDTSGLLVVAKTDAAHHGLSEQFQAHGADGRLLRRYFALVWGSPERPSGQISAALGRNANNRTKISVVRDDAGRHAVTHYELRESFGRDPFGRPVASLVALVLETGRTHQIRVHMSHIGHPVLGDATYGASHKTAASRLPEAAQSALAALNRQALHAAELGFEHPRTGKALNFASPLPPDMAALHTALGGRVPAAAVPAPRRGTSTTSKSRPNSP
jgi:23S rRNA pseudouridine1911/1915/1917 synthase